VEQQLSACLGKRQVAKCVEDNKILPVEIIGQAALAPGAALCLKPVDQIDDSAAGACRSRSASGVAIVTGGAGSRRRARMLMMTCRSLDMI
jgi:hypothetical protein